MSTLVSLEPVLSPALVQSAHAAARASARPVRDVLEELSALAPDAFTAQLGALLGYPVLDLIALSSLLPAFDLVPYAEASTRGCVPLRREDGTALLVIADPFADGIEAWAREALGLAIVLALAHPNDLRAYLAAREAGMRAIDEVLGSAVTQADQARPVEDLSLASIGADSSPVVKLVNSTLYDAIKAQASDIHLESAPTGMDIKYRIDGVLISVGSIAGGETAEQVISRIKVMAELDIGERRVPQDGRLRVAVQGREIDVRVSIMPSIAGEDAVLRILDKRALADQMRGLRLDILGFDEATLASVRRISSEPYGMVLVTGPTGSGKTTTLYAAISEVNSGCDKIITIEDPVEYQIRGVLQIPVNERKGLNFARGLRSILRHDPDKIMVGEIRDPETAQIAVQAALTGHLVFTTVHANNVFDVIGRFMHMGVDAYSFVSALNGILAQRLVRIVCPRCAAPAAPDDKLLRDSGLHGADLSTYRLVVGRGCGECRGSGSRGRKAVGELLHLTDEMREMIVARAPIRRLKEVARRDGTRFLRDAALDLVQRGQTTLEEVNRVTFVA
ncbi:MAG: type II/IV secretion system protein [Burkholderiales bacterium]|nr:type II/IV secretion system protein [Burkholderiales bacterium]